MENTNKQATKAKSYTDKPQRQPPPIIDPISTASGPPRHKHKRTLSERFSDILSPSSIKQYFEKNILGESNCSTHWVSEGVGLETEGTGRVAADRSWESVRFMFVFAESELSQTFSKSQIGAASIEDSWIEYLISYIIEQKRASHILETVNYSLYEKHPTLQSQFELFAADRARNTDWTAENSLFVIQLGSQSRDVFLESALQKLNAIGARSFLFLQPPLRVLMGPDEEVSRPLWSPTTPTSSTLREVIISIHRDFVLQGQGDTPKFFYYDSRNLLLDSSGPHNTTSEDLEDDFDPITGRGGPDESCSSDRRLGRENYGYTVDTCSRGHVEDEGYSEEWFQTKSRELAREVYQFLDRA